jgi:hypothetical protein
MLVFKDRSMHRIFALERISQFTICSPISQEENSRPAVEKSGMCFAELRAAFSLFTRSPRFTKLS